MGGIKTWAPEKIKRDNRIVVELNQNSGDPGPKDTGKETGKENAVGFDDAGSQRKGPKRKKKDRKSKKHRKDKEKDAADDDAQTPRTPPTKPRGTLKPRPTKPANAHAEETTERSRRESRR